MNHSSPHSPLVKRTYRLFLISSLIFLLQIVLPLFAANAEASPGYPKGYSLKALDLSRNLNFEDLMAAGQLDGPLYPTHDLSYPMVNASFGEAMQAASGLTLIYEYNNLDQVTRITYPDNKYKSYQYSSCCPFKIDSITERSGRTTFYAYDQANRLTAVTDPAGGVTAFTYDANGNRASITDPKGNITRFDYDANNNLIKKTYADGTFDSFSYDANNPSNNLLARTNARGIKTNYLYSDLGKLARFWDEGGTATYYFYDNFGRETSAYSTDYWYLDRTYDANSQLLTLTLRNHPETRVAYQYDALGRRTLMTRGSGQPVAYAYDHLNRLTRVTAGDQVYIYGYAGASPLVRTLTRPNGAVTTYDYDILNRLTQMTTRIWDTVVCSYAYSYNDQDLRAGETATEPASPPPYVSSLTNYEYNNVNALTRITNSGVTDLVYDASGNLTNGYTPQGYPFTAVYDGSNRLTTFSYTVGSDVYRTGYNYVGNLLVQKIVSLNGQATDWKRYLYDGFQIMQEQDRNFNIISEYTWGQGLPGGIGGLLDLYQGAVHFSYLYDGKGNVTALLDPNGNVAATYQYDPFGAPRVPANSIKQPFQFSTKPYDEKTGLCYYGYRFYVPALGRWLTRDPLGEESGINLYRFAVNNPLNMIDPNGLTPTTMNNLNPLQPPPKGWLAPTADVTPRDICYANPFPPQQPPTRPAQFPFLPPVPGPSLPNPPGFPPEPIGPSGGAGW